MAPEVEEFMKAVSISITDVDEVMLVVLMNIFSAFPYAVNPCFRASIEKSMII